ncbi:MAG: hypothetical protein K6F33_11940 [Bacteroidales bacterium]|nr:hypothetical protein [Bacteroidales bacterium]
MKRISTIFAVLIAVLICFASCGSSSSEDEPTPTPTPTPENPTGKVAYLTAKEFAASEWSGTDANSKEVTLKVTSITEMTLNYYTKTLAKKTEEFTLQTAQIAYTFDEATGKFSGKDGSGTQYSGSLTSKTALKLKMPSEEVAMTKK